jgi:uncharacterized protein HemX
VEDAEGAMPSIANQKDVLEHMPDAPKRFALFGALAAAVLMAMIGGFAWVQWREVDHANSLAQRERETEISNLQYRMMESDRAAIELARMQRNESRFLADLARQHRRRRAQEKLMGVR